jgi:hypothetical protein
MDPNATTVERIIYYVENDDEPRAHALAQLADYLEECFTYEIEFND